MKKTIKKMICEYIREYEKNPDIVTSWQEPLVGFAHVENPYILDLKNIISPTHCLPRDVLEDSSIVIAYFLPFKKEMALTNRVSDELASPEWAQAYEETNTLLNRINTYLVEKLTEYGYHAAISPESLAFDEKKLISNWSHRHFAYAAGLGTFGMNNMLITEKGCCGRFSTVVTNLDVFPDEILKEERCLYKKNGSCGVCMNHCPVNALSHDGFNREKCYGRCKENAEVHTQFGSSYELKSSDSTAEGSQVCGKCAVYAPCTFIVDTHNIKW